MDDQAIAITSLALSIVNTIIIATALFFTWRQFKFTRASLYIERFNSGAILPSRIAADKLLQRYSVALRG
ncbi:MAG: hypothetical protein AAF624_13815, partial [Bacteroidota bacterium]